MRKHLLSLVISLSFFLCSLNLHAQWVAIPDTNFGTWLNTNGYSNCLQGNNTVGWEMDTTCNEVMSGWTMICTNSNISSLEGLSYFHNLNFLSCDSNMLSSLPVLPNALSVLFCNNNAITSLPPLPSTLWALGCNYNNLSSLPALPASIGVLECSHNQITALPNQLHYVQALDCSFNQLNTLPVMSTAVMYLNCSHNSISNIPFNSNPAILRELVCNDNQLLSLPMFSDSLYELDCSNNPGITCFPRIGTIINLNFSNTGIACVPNYGVVVSSIPPINTFQLCDSGNVNACPLFSNASGKVYMEVNTNCIKDTLESPLRNLNVKILGNNGYPVIQTLTGNSGGYFFETGNVYPATGFIQVDTANTPFSVTCPGNNLQSLYVSFFDFESPTANFGLNCSNGFDLQAKSVVGFCFAPGNTTLVNITAGDGAGFYNAHCAAGVSGAVTVTINGSAHYTAPANGALTPMVNGNTLTYTIADFGAVNFFTDFNIIVQTDTTAVLGSQICITVSVTPTAGDNNPNNNTLTHCFPVVASYDPNDKTAYPDGDIDTTQKEITYTVHFQNTGTAEAQHIYITDTLDTDIDESSFQLLAYSHQPMVQIEQNRVRFNFPNINLPDSNTNEPLSHGYVQYKIKLKDNLPIGTTINNTAHIYFDFNAPVVTNTTTNTITTNTSVKTMSREPLAFGVYPNPTNSSFTISIPENLIGETVTVKDVTGRMVREEKLKAQNSKIETADFANGIYFVTIGSRTQKLIIQK